jgi:hypothetical protein
MELGVGSDGAGVDGVEMKVLVLTSEPIGADDLRSALGSGTDPADTEVMVVAPALQESGFKFWFSDVDDAIVKAEEVRRETLERLSDDGVPASADTGEADPTVALEDALRTFRADRIVLFTHPEGDERYREALDPEEIQSRFGIAVDRAALPAR